MLVATLPIPRHSRWVGRTHTVEHRFDGFDGRYGFGYSDLLDSGCRLRGFVGGSRSFLCSGHDESLEFDGLKYSGWRIQADESILGAGRADAHSAGLTVFSYTRIFHGIRVTLWDQW